MEKYSHILSLPILLICRQQFRSLIDARFDFRRCSRSRVYPGTVAVLIFSSEDEAFRRSNRALNLQTRINLTVSFDV